MSLHELVFSYAAGALEQDERHAFEDHLRECAACRSELLALREVTDELAASVAAAPPAGLRDRLMSRVHSASRTPGVAYDQDGIFVTRGAEIPWENLAPGILYKVLSIDPSRRYRSMLVQMDAGARLPKHRHGGDEEIFVVSGDLYFEGAAMGPGDYCRAGGGTTHEDTFTKNGCTFLAIASQDNQFLAG